VFDPKKYLKNIDKYLKNQKKITPEQSNYIQYLRKDKNYLKILNQKMKGDLKGVQVMFIRHLWNKDED
jgi:hypothetical protein